MTHERWQRVEALYLEALPLPEDQRARFLDDACGTDEALNQEVASLLAQDAPEFLETPAMAMAAKLMASDEGVFTGTLIGPYLIGSRIGAGGMGQVYRATDTRLQRELAIKVLPDRGPVSPLARERFEREARAASALNHPNICTVYDVGADPPFIAMELLEGETLQQRLTCGGIDVPALIDVALAVTDALDAAHRMGIVHRDIKPANIFLTQRGPKILDFGIAKAMSRSVALGSSDPTVRPADAQLTEPGTAVGTASYMSPEQVRAEPLDARTDLFSFGVVLYEMATGTLPFCGDSAGVVFDGILNRAPIRPAQLNAALPADLARVIDRCLEKDRERRYQHASDICTDLRRLKMNVDSGQMRMPAPTRRWIVIVPVALAVLVLFIAGYAYLHRPPQLTDKDTIVLADFTNTTGDAVFDVTLRQGLAIQLEQSPFLSLVSDESIQRTLGLMGQAGDARLTPEVARDICERTGGAAVLDGSIAALGNQYVLALRARNCRTGDVLDEEQVQAARKEDVLNALSRMASTFRTRVGESLATLEKHSTPIDEATTGSLEAFRAYSAGRRMHASSGPAALPLFKRATEIDPNFAMAHAFLGTTYGELGQSDLSAESTRTAYRLRDRVSDRERFFIAASYDLRVTGNLEQAHQTYEMWMQTYPRAWEPHGFLAGIVYPIFGRYQQAVEEGKRTIELNPDFSLGYGILAFAYEGLGQFGDAENTLQLASARHVDLPNALVIRYDLAFLNGQQADMERQAALGAGSAVEDMLSDHEAFALAYSGHLQQANAKSQHATDLAQQAAQGEPAALYEAGAALREAFFGHASEGRRRAAAALGLSTARDVTYGAALAFGLSGDTSRSQELTNDLERRFPEDTAVRFGYVPVLRAQLALNRGEPATALELLQIAAPYDLGEPPSSFTGLFGALYPVYLRGEAHLAARHGAQAAAEFQKILDHRGVVVSDPIGALAHLQLGRALALSGDPARAKTAYQNFLTLWKDADSALPILKQAQAEFAKLP